MLIKRISIVILAFSLSGCAGKNHNTCIVGKDLPEMPIAGDGVALEIEKLCTDSFKCFHLNNWLNELYLFRQQYLLYKRI